jgi:hypothetical protein
MCRKESYAFREGLFRLTTVGILENARMYFDRHYLHFNLAELQYLDKIFHIVNNLLKAYVTAIPDVKTYVISALGTANFVDPAPAVNNSILYYQLHEEINQRLL